MQVWKRRLVALVAIGAGSAGLMSTAGAQTPPSIPDFTIPSFTLPDFSIPPPTFTIPPPTMPPSSTVTTSPPPTMPPVTFPSTSIPTLPTIPDASDLLEDLFDDLLGDFEGGGEIFDDLRAMLDEIIASFGQ